MVRVTASSAKAVVRMIHPTIRTRARNREPAACLFIVSPTGGGWLRHAWMNEG